MAEEILLETILKAIVRNPESVGIEKRIDDMGTLLSVKVAKPDMGIVIGRSGIHANAIKLVTKLCGIANGNRVSVKIDEPNA